MKFLLINALLVLPSWRQPAAQRSQGDQADRAKEEYVKTHYIKYEYRIPMRDGKRLFTEVFVPKDTAESYPFLIVRTPYSIGPYGEDKYPTSLGPSDEFEKSGYIFVSQAVRGSYGSDDEFVEMRPHIDKKQSSRDVDDSSDAYDTIEFLLKHIPNNNGKVGIWGISYPGFYAAASMIDSHPALVAVSPQAPIMDLFQGDDYYHGGAFMLAADSGLYKLIDPKKESLPQSPYPEIKMTDSYKFYLESGSPATLDQRYLRGRKWSLSDEARHDTYDSFWQERDLSRHMTGVKCAVLVVGGWFDAEDLSGPRKLFDAVVKSNPETPITLVEGPWSHGGWNRGLGLGDHLGDISFETRTGDYFQTNVQFPFFEHYLKGKGGVQPKTLMFETGTNVWRSFSSWPPKNASPKMLYLRGGGKLSLEPPTEASSVDSYVSDPAHPVPFVGYTTDRVPPRYMVDDQRFASYRPDVLVYQSDVLTEDVTIAGPVSPKLKIASSGTDSDFDVKLIDVHPDDAPDPLDVQENGRNLSVPVHMGGYQQLLRGEPMRAKFRHSWEKPEALVPGEQADLNFVMPDVFHTFRAGHRIMVQVQSSWFPLTDRNPQTFTDIPNARADQFVKATEQVFHQRDAASGVEVLVLPQP